MNIRRFLKDFSEKPSFLFVALHGLIGFFISTLVIIRSFAIEPSENIASYNWLLVFPYIFIFNAGFKGIIALFTYLFFAKPAVEFAKNLKTDRRRSNIKLRSVLFILTVGFLSKTFNLSYGNMLLLFIVHKFLTPLAIIICIIPYIFLLIYEYNKKELGHHAD